MKNSHNMFTVEAFLMEGDGGVMEEIFGAIRAGFSWWWDLSHRGLGQNGVG